MSPLQTNIEICQIHKAVRQVRERSGLLGLHSKLVVYSRYVADWIHPNGVEVIAQTPEFRAEKGEITATGNTSLAVDRRDALEEARHHMTQQLIASGWEVMNTDQFGAVTSLKRQSAAVARV